MSRAIHSFHAVNFLVILEPEHTVSVVCIVARSFPKFGIEDIWSYNFFESSDTILSSNKVHQLIIEFSTVRIKESTSRRQFMSVEEALCSTHYSVVTLFCFFFEVDILSEQVFGRECSGIYSLKRIIFVFAKPIGRRIFHHFESLHEICIWDVRTSTKINEITTSVSSHFITIANFTFDSLDLEGVLNEKFKSIFFGQDQTLKLLLTVYNFLSGFFDFLIVGICEFVITSVAIIEETCFSGRSMSQVDTKIILQSLTKYVST